MMTQSEQSIWNALKTSNLVEGELPSLYSNDSPWYIRTMLGFSGWIAAFFLLGFLASTLSLIYDDEEAFIIISVGLVGNVFAYAVFRISQKSEFLRQLGLVFNLCGQLMVAWGIYNWLQPNMADCFFSILIYQAILIALLADFISRFLTTWFAMIALCVYLGQLGLPDVSVMIASLSCYFVWINDLKWHKLKNLWEPVGYGLAMSLLQLNVQDTFARESYELLEFFNLFIGDDPNAIWIDTINWVSEYVVSAIFVVLLIKLAKQYEIKIQSQSGLLMLIGGGLLLLINNYIPGVSGALLLLLIGFMKRRRVLISLAIIAMLGFVSWYYYSLSLTLLTKSIVLMGCGLCFLIGFYYLNVFSGSKQLSLSHLKQKYSLDKPKFIAVGCMLIILLSVNFNIYKKENILKYGQVVLLKLVPVDPRSLMQGDYMRLSFDIERTLLGKDKSDEINKKNASGYFVVNLDENHVGTFSALYDTQNLLSNQVKMQYRVRDFKIRLATHAFFFQEGTASEYENATYGEFRVASNGELLLNNLRDDHFDILGLNRRSN